MQHRFTAIFEWDGEWWIASAVELPGALSQGRTIEEARENLMDAARELLLAHRQLAEEEAVGKEIVREVLEVTVE